MHKRLFFVLTNIAFQGGKICNRASVEALQFLIGSYTRRKWSSRCPASSCFSRSKPILNVYENQIRSLCNEEPVIYGIYSICQTVYSPHLALAIASKHSTGNYVNLMKRHSSLTKSTFPRKGCKPHIRGS